MKPYTIAALAAAASVCAISPATAAPVADSVEARVAIAQEFLVVLSDLTDVLNTVQDKASADAAAPQVKKLAKKFKAIQAKQETMGPPSDAIRKGISQNHPELEEEANAVLMNFLMSLQTLMEDESNPCFGSTALLQAIMGLQ